MHNTIEDLKSFLAVELLAPSILKFSDQDSSIENYYNFV